jgi:O-antigen ligase
MTGPFAYLPDASEKENVPWRGLAFIAAASLAWITLKPFGDLGSADALDLRDGREIPTYLCFGGLAVLCLLQVVESDHRGLRCLMTPSFLGLAAWIGLTCATSQDVGTSLKRAVLSGLVAIVAASLMLLPRGCSHLASLLAVAAGLLLALSYFGVIFMPEYAVHQATDLGEPALVGSWRGVFAHKNDASAVFSMIAFVGLFVARSGRSAEGWLICGLSLLFVALSGGKSSTILCAASVIVSLAALRGGRAIPWTLGLATPLVALNAMGVGSAASPQLAAISASLPLDTTFTGRIEIWRFVLGEIPRRLFLGHGFSAFWNSEAVRRAAADADSWVGNAAHAHNGYLDAMLSMGAPGLAFVLWALVVQPMMDIRSAARANADPALLLMLTQIWLFGAYLSSLESFFFDRNNPIWITFLFAVFGLRYIASYRVAP